MARNWRRHAIIVAACLATVAIVWLVHLRPWAGLRTDLDGVVRISRAGNYALDRDVAGIVIHANDVSINLSRHTVKCETDIGIEASGRQRVEVSNGIVTGCLVGMNAAKGAEYIIENMRFTDNRYIGLTLGLGSGHVVRNSEFANMAGDGKYAIGLDGVGVGGFIEKNSFHNINPAKGEGVAIIVSDGETGVVIKDSKMIAAKPENTIAVWVADRASASFVGNTISGYERLIVGRGTITKLAQDASERVK